jgi:hypothetical protein
MTEYDTTDDEGETAYSPIYRYYCYAMIPVSAGIAYSCHLVLAKLPDQMVSEALTPVVALAGIVFCIYVCCGYLSKTLEMHDIDDSETLVERLQTAGGDTDTDAGTAPGETSPIETLQQTYARGEIDDAEFEHRLERLIEFGVTDDNTDSDNAETGRVEIPIKK